MNDLDWHYFGDVNLREGGLYWRNDAYDADQVHVVQVLPSKASGGPDNLFRILVGIVDMSGRERLSAALAMAGLAPDTATRWEVVNAFVGAHGVEADEDFFLRAGPVDQLHVRVGDVPDPDPDVVLKSNTSLRRWLKREYLHPEPKPSAAAVP